MPKRILRFGAVLVMATAAALVTACNNSKSIVDEKTLNARVEVGAAVRIAELTNRSNGTACVLFPYASDIEIDERNPDAEALNAHLRQTGFMGEEMQWAIVIKSEAGVEVHRIDRSRRLDLMSPSDIIRLELHQRLPSQFVPSDGYVIPFCLPLATAAVTKVQGGDRAYVVFGKVE